MDRVCSCTRVAGCALNAAIMVMLLTVGVCQVCSAQELFKVQNATQQKWPQEEANQIFLVATRTVQREFRLPSPVVKPRLTLILGADENAADVAKRELKLTTWDKYFFAEGVVLMSLDQIVTPEAKKALALRALTEAEVSVSVAKLRNKR